MFSISVILHCHINFLFEFPFSVLCLSWDFMFSVSFKSDVIACWDTFIIIILLLLSEHFNVIITFGLVFVDDLFVCMLMSCDFVVFLF